MPKDNAIIQKAMQQYHVTQQVLTKKYPELMAELQQLSLKQRTKKNMAGQELYVDKSKNLNTIKKFLQDTRTTKNTQNKILELIKRQS